MCVATAVKGVGAEPAAASYSTKKLHSMPGVPGGTQPPQLESSPRGARAPLPRRVLGALTLKNSLSLERASAMFIFLLMSIWPRFTTPTQPWRRRRLRPHSTSLRGGGGAVLLSTRACRCYTYARVPGRLRLVASTRLLTQPRCLPLQLQPPHPPRSRQLCVSSGAPDRP